MNRSDEQVLETTRAGFPVLDGVSAFLAGVRCLFGYRDFLARPATALPALPDSAVSAVRGELARSELSGSLGEYLSSALLSECGLTMNQAMLVNSAEELNSVADALDYPVVLKTAARGLNHKSDVEGVVLPIDDAEALHTAYADMAKRLGTDTLVAPLIEGVGVEMILGVSRDEQFGPMVVMGFGGVHAEVLEDVAVLAPPFDGATARRALDGLRLRPLLDGVRGQPASDIDAFCEMAARLSAVAVAFAVAVIAAPAFAGPGVGA